MKSERPAAAEYGGIGRPPMEISPLPMVEGFVHFTKKPATGMEDCSSLKVPVVAG